MPKKNNKTPTLTEDELRSMTRNDMIDGMTDREVAFCEYYINDYNITMAAIKAGYKTLNNKTISKLVRNKPKVINYIAWLKLKLYDKAMVKAEDIFNSYAKMAFYDITDYMEKKGNRVYLKDFSLIDGQVIQEITQNANGITVKFPDRLKAFEKLENYMDHNPLDWKRNIEERKVQILEEKLAIEKTKAGLLDEIEDDGFLTALENAAEKLKVVERDLEEVDNE